MKNILKFGGFLTLGLLLFWYVYQGQNIEAIRNSLKNINYFWVLMGIFVMFVSHVSRSYRWLMLIEPLGKKVKLSNSILATFVGYFVNLAIPRMGELSRCAVLGKYEGVSSTKLFGTVVIERAIDLVMFVLCFFLAVVSQLGVFKNLYQQYAAAETTEGEVSIKTFVLLITLGILFLLFVGFRKQIKETVFFQKLQQLLQDIIEGFRTIRKLKSFPNFVFHTLLIWLCYYLMMYTSFKVFDFTNDLSPLVALAVFVLGSIGMIVPAPGGLGSFHYFVIGGLLIYLPHVEESTLSAFPLLVHGVQTVFIMVCGVLSLILLPLLNRKKTHEIQTERG